MTKSILTPVSLALTVAALSAATPDYPTASVEYRFPDDAGVLDVKRDFGAKGDGVADDTAAIQAAVVTALKGNYRNPRFVYLPAGTYLLSAPIRARVTDAPEGQGGWCDGWRCGLILVGESRERTVLLLRDRAPGFDDPAKPRAVVVTGSTGHGQGHDSRKGGWGNEAFQNTLMNFTVDTGVGNPGAIGIDFLASNRGTLEEITIRSGDPEQRGAVGLSMARPWPGPGLVKNVWIDGFDVGLQQNSMDCSMTYEHILLTHQRVVGVAGTGSPFMSLRGVVSRSAVPAFRIEGRDAVVSILDSVLTYTEPAPLGVADPGPGSGQVRGKAEVGLPSATGSGSRSAALIADCHLTLKGVTVEGYSVAVSRPGPAVAIAPAVDFAATDGRGAVALWTAREPLRLHAGSNGTPDLLVKETPAFHHSDFTQWANPRKFESLGSRTAGIQEAIDSGAEIVYLPNGSYAVSETIVLRGKVRKILGMEANLNRAKGVGSVEPLFRFDGVASQAVILEHLSGGDRCNVVEHNGAGTLVVRKSSLRYRNTICGTGDAFLEDLMGGRTQVLHPQALWARQLNTEFGEESQLENHGGRVWVLGMKVEGWPSAILNVGGLLECYGLYTMVGSGDAKRTGMPAPFVENREGWLAVPFRIGGQGNYRIQFRDTWKGVEKRQDGGPRERNLVLGGDRFDLPPVVVPKAELTPAPPPAAGTPPRVVAAAGDPAYPELVLLDFDGPLDVGTASPVAHYRLEPSAEVVGVRITPEGTRVVLRLKSPLADGVAYRVTCQGLKDRAGKALVGTEAAFTVWHRGDGLKAEFWNGDGTNGVPVASRIERKVDHWWGDGSPAEGVAPMAFRARWSGTLRPRVGGTYRFQTGVRTGARILLDGEVIHDVWVNQKNEWTHSRPVELEAGRRYAIIFETYATGHAGARLKWEGPFPNQFLDDDVLFAERPK